MDAESFDAFYTTSFSQLVGQLYALCGDAADAQECVQEAFVRAWDRRRTLDAEPSATAWVRTVAYDLAMSRRRRSRRARRRRSEQSVDTDPMARALAQLPDDQRRVVVLHHVCDLPVTEIAREVGVSVSTITSRLDRARAALAPLRGEPVLDQSPA